MAAILTCKVERPQVTDERLAAKTAISRRVYRAMAMPYRRKLAHLADKLDDTHEKVEEMHATCCKPKGRAGRL